MTFRIIKMGIVEEIDESILLLNAINRVIVSDTRLHSNENKDFREIRIVFNKQRDESFVHVDREQARRVYKI